MISRRKVLTSVGAILAAAKARAGVSFGSGLGGILGPIASSSVGQTFDFYVSPTGSDTNTGTLGSPWAITSLMLIANNSNAYSSGAQNCINCLATAGKRVGFLPGTYYITTAFTGTISSGSNSMTVSGITGALSVGMALVSGLGSAYTTGTYGWGPKITAIVGSTITLSSNAAANLTGATIVATFMKEDQIVGATQIIGGTVGSPTYWASSDSSGHESARTATLDAIGGSGVYGAFIDDGTLESGPIIAHTGQYPTSYTVSNATVSGLRLTGYSFLGLRIGAHSALDGPSGITGVTIKDCEFFGSSSLNNTHIDNIVSVWIDCTNGTRISNCWFHDCAGHAAGSADHLNAIQIWGAFTSQDYVTTGTVIEKCTCVNAGNIYGKETDIAATTIQNNYVDMTAFQKAAGLQDFTGAPTTGLTGTTIFRNNIIIFDNTNSEGGLIGGPTKSNSYGWTTPVEAYNNTIVVTTGGVPSAFWLNGSSGAAGAVKYYNNIYVNNSTAGNDNIGYGVVSTNPSAPAIFDYNLYYSPTVVMQWRLWTNGGFTTAVTGSPFSTAASFASALSSNGGISGAETHSSVGTSPTFTNTGIYAALYKLSSGSAGTSGSASPGSTDGTSLGTACDMGAWGGATPPTQIGCDFAT